MDLVAKLIVINESANFILSIWPPVYMAFVEPVCYQYFEKETTSVSLELSSRARPDGYDVMRGIICQNSARKG